MDLNTYKQTFQYLSTDMENPSTTSKDKLELVDSDSDSDSSSSSSDSSLEDSVEQKQVNKKRA